VGFEFMILDHMLLTPNIVRLARSMSHHIINQLTLINNHASIRLTTFFPTSFAAQLFTISQIIENTIQRMIKLLIPLMIIQHLKRKSLIPNTSHVASVLLIILPVKFAIGIRIRERRFVKKIANCVVLERDSFEFCANA
jgi:hypothetical protein